VKALIVSDPHVRGTLAAVRALARAGWEVGVGSPARGTTTSSRFCAHWHRVPAPDEPLDAFGAAVSRAISVVGYEVVFGGGDAEVLALSALRESLAAHVPYAPHPRLVRAMDKLELDRAARRAGLQTPATATAGERAETRLPVVVKPRLHWEPGRPGAPARLEAAVCHDRAEVVARVAEIEAWDGEAVVQEYVGGDLFAYVALTDPEGAVVTGFAQAAGGIWPLGNGVFTRAETCVVDESFARGVAALLRDLGWFGIAQLQFQVPEGGAPRLIDLNGRFYLSLALPTVAGLNLPALWAGMAVGRTRPAPGRLPDGLRYQWLEGDLRRALGERRGGLLADVIATIRFAQGATHTLWARDDPLPTARHLAHVPFRAANKARDRRRERRSQLSTSRRPRARVVLPGDAG
jgi:predicted ATP-grasp superfamily ATP-dependent carboligase